MSKLTDDMNAILESLDMNRSIVFSKDDSTDRHKAKDKLRAYKLIEKYGKQSWQLTIEGYRAIELGGFDEWLKEKASENSKSWKKPIITFIIKFWWTVIIPLVVGLILLGIEYEWFK